MNRSTLTPDAEEILVYLYNTVHPLERTADSIRAASRAGERADLVLRQLVRDGYLSSMGYGEYQLTPLGRQAARASINRQPPPVEPPPNTFDTFDTFDNMESSTVHLPGIQDTFVTSLDNRALFTAPLTLPDESHEREDQTLHTPSSSVPSLYHHPLRLSTALISNPPGSRPNVTLRFLLAFELPKDALPVPVLHGDVLGRSRNADICLRHDDYISARHCRFEVRQEESGYRLYVEDLNSRNGTYIAHMPLQAGRAYPLQHGTRLHVGNTAFIVVQVP